MEASRPAVESRWRDDVGLAPGTRLGADRYEITEIAGIGRSSLRYRARDHRLRRPVVIEEFLPAPVTRRGRRVLVAPRSAAGFEDGRGRFVDRARALGRLTASGIQRVYEIFDDNGTSYLVSEHVEGPTLGELLDERGGPLPEPVVRDVARRIARSLRPAHAIDVVHGALGPDVLVLTATGRLVITRFDLAGAPGPGHRGTDVRGLAVTLWHLATGRPHPVPPAPAAPPIPTGERSPTLVDALRAVLEPGAPDPPGDLDTLLDRLGIARPMASALPVPFDTLSDIVAPDAGGTGFGGSGWEEPAAPEPLATGSLAPGSPDSDPAPPAPALAPPPAAAGTGGVDETVLWSDADRPSESVTPPTRPDPAPTDATVLGEPTRPDPTRTDATGLGEPTLRDSTRPDPTRIGGPMRPGSVAGGGPSAGPDDPNPLGARSATGDPTAVSDSDATVHEASGASDDPRSDAGADRSGPLLAPAPFATPVRGTGAGRSRADRRLLLPLALTAVVVTSAVPIAGGLVLAGLILPGLATIGDRRARIDERGIAPAGPEPRVGPWLPLWFVRNVLRSTVRAVPAAVVGGGLLVIHEMVVGADGATTGHHWGLRGIGAVIALVLCAGTARPSATFRTRIGLDALWSRIEPRGRVGERLIVTWIVLLAVVAVALLLDPTRFPLS